MSKRSYIEYPMLSIIWRMWDNRRWWVEYPHGNWVTTSELERDFQRWPDLIVRRLSRLEVNIRWWYRFHDARYRKRHDIPYVCSMCDNIVEAKDSYCPTCAKKLNLRESGL